MSRLTVAELNAAYGLSQDVPPIQFIKFPKMKTEQDLAAFVERNLHNDCIVSEKIHGANFPIVINIGANGHIQPCKRSNPIQDDKSLFSGCLRPLMKENRIIAIKTLMQKIPEIYPSASTVYLYTELIGTRVPQTHCQIVYTNEEFDFIVFQIVIDGVRLSIRDAHALCTSCDIPHVPYKIINIAQLMADCNYEEGTLLSLPHMPSGLAKSNNILNLSRSIMEGLIIQPLHKTTLYKLRRKEFFETKTEEKKQNTQNTQNTQNMQTIHPKTAKLDTNIGTYLRQKYLHPDCLSARDGNMLSKMGNEWNTLPESKKKEVLLADIMEDIMSNTNEEEQSVAALPAKQLEFFQNSMRPGIVKWLLLKMVTEPVS